MICQVREIILLFFFLLRSNADILRPDNAKLAKQKRAFAKIWKLERRLERFHCIGLDFERLNNSFLSCPSPSVHLKEKKA